MSIASKKYQNAILYLCKRQNGALYGKKKLAKLLYYVDFDRYEYKESGVSVTGDKYTKLPMGPVPDHYMDVVKALVESGKLVVGQQEYVPGYSPVEVYTCKAEPDMTVFDEDDKAILDRVSAIYGGLNGKQLEELSHAEAPFVGTEPSKEIAYELAYYRETQFNGISKP
ncbi:MAG TPA: Panacea domain-containing protein [Patescibacteria group bacterium]|jgi:uncharacterized phage-associated protein|nr:Panacea domain-containing protein [Patescibacteria group bacterium]